MQRRFCSCLIACPNAGCCRQAISNPVLLLNSSAVCKALSSLPSGSALRKANNANNCTVHNFGMQNAGSRVPRQSTTGDPYTGLDTWQLLIFYLSQLMMSSGVQHTSQSTTHGLALQPGVALSAPLFHDLALMLQNCRPGGSAAEAGPCPCTD